MKCGRTGCSNDGVYQPLVRIKASILPANGNDILATIRIPFVLCPKHKAQATESEIIDVVPKRKMEDVIQLAKDKTGASPNKSRTDVHWVRILGRRTDGPHG